MTPLLQHFQQAEPAGPDPSGQIFHVGLMLEQSSCPGLDFTGAVPRGPHFGQLLVALMAVETLLLLQAGGISMGRAGTVTQGRIIRDTTRTLLLHHNTTWFPFPGQGISNYLPSRQLLKINFFSLTPSLKEISSKDAPCAPPELPIPIW